MDPLVVEAAAGSDVVSVLQPDAERVAWANLAGRGSCVPPTRKGRRVRVGWVLASTGAADSSVDAPHPRRRERRTVRLNA